VERPPWIVGEKGQRAALVMCVERGATRRMNATTDFVALQLLVEGEEAEDTMATETTAAAAAAADTTVDIEDEERLQEIVELFVAPRDAEVLAVDLSLGQGLASIVIEPLNRALPAPAHPVILVETMLLATLLLRLVLRGSATSAIRVAISRATVQRKSVDRVSSFQPFPNPDIQISQKQTSDICVFILISSRKSVT